MPVPIDALLAYGSRALTVRYAPDQPRDDHGRFGSGGSGSTATLEKKLVDYKADRPLTGSEARAISAVIPGAKTTTYLKVPGVDVMHAAMGFSDLTPDVNVDDYMMARGKLFAEQPYHELPISSLTFTQPNINVEKIKGEMPPAQRNAPVQVLQHGDAYYLMNGHHRVVKAAVLGHTSVPARVFNTASVPQRQAADRKVYSLRRAAYGLLPSAALFFEPDGHGDSSPLWIIRGV